MTSMEETKGLEYYVQYVGNSMSILYCKILPNCFGYVVSLYEFYVLGVISNLEFNLFQGSRHQIFSDWLDVFHS